MRSRSNTFRGLSQNEKGAALVEFAMVASVLLMIVFGIVEFGLAFRDRLTMANSTQGASRIAAALGNDAASDYETLLGLAQSLQTLPASGIGIVKSVDIYEADGNGDPPASGCPGPKCNHYVYAPGHTLTCDWDPCPNPDPSEFEAYGGTWIPGLPPTAGGRDDALPGLAVLGLRVEFAHSWITTGLLPLPNVNCDGTPGANCWYDTAIQRLEPQVFE
ncbi:MAG: pilus assembly protein [Acidimicrobiia bacterium]|nr:pilus assembly protein [Acidimicrobiia bacterium]